MSIAAFLALASFAVLPVHSASATITRESFENCLLERANQERSLAGVTPLEMAYDLVDPVRDWSEWMSVNELQHMPSTVRDPILPDGWTAWGEIVAYWGNPNLADCNEIHEMWMNSSGHRANILRAGFRHVAIGTHVDGSGWWATQLFFDADPCDGTFCDDDGSVFEGDIEKIVAAGITNGCNPSATSEYCPDQEVTRGAMAAFLARALHLGDATGIDFIDDDTSIFEQDIEKIAAAGITYGCNPPTGNEFCPDDLVTRGEMAAFLARALQLPPADGIDFTDDDGSDFEDYIERIAARGITLGCDATSNEFCPGDYVTRGQMAAFLARALDL
jgi:hypothetical protein